MLCLRAYALGHPQLVSMSLSMGQVWAVFLFYTCELHMCSYLGSIFHVPWPEVSIAGVSVCFSATYLALSILGMVAYIHRQARQAGLTHHTPSHRKSWRTFRCPLCSTARQC